MELSMEIIYYLISYLSFIPFKLSYFHCKKRYKKTKNYK